MTVMRFHNLEHLEHLGSQKLFRSEGLKNFICAACNYVICAECNYTFAEAPPSTFENVSSILT